MGFVVSTQGKDLCLSARNVTLYTPEQFPRGDEHSMNVQSPKPMFPATDNYKETQGGRGREVGGLNTCNKDLRRPISGSILPSPLPLTTLRVPTWRFMGTCKVG